MGLSNGIFCFGPSLFVSVAFCLSITSSSLCNFLVLDDGNIWRNAGIRAIGFWCYEATNGNRYGDSEGFGDGDDAIHTARALGLTGNIIGFVVWVIYLFAACIPYPAPVMMCTGLLCFFAAFFEGMKLWILKSEVYCDPIIGFGGCEIYKGARCCISAVVFWFLASCMTCAHGKERMDAKGRGDN